MNKMRNCIGKIRGELKHIVESIIAKTTVYA